VTSRTWSRGSSILQNMAPRYALEISNGGGMKTQQFRAPVGVSTGKGRVLLVDDEDVLQRTLARLLMHEGYVVVGARDGAEAISALGAEPYDVVVSDVRMPGMSGLELLKVIRTFDMDVPVILMTGAPDVEGAALAVELGALRYFTKPTENKVLITAIEKGVTLRRLANAKREAAALVGSPGGPSDRIALEVAFERTLGKLWVAFQPIVAHGAKGIFGYEALMRSDDAELRFPDAILDAAERLGRMHDLGRRMRKLTMNAFEDAPQHLLCFVNLHALDLEDPQLLDPQDALRPLARRVVLEITERSRLGDLRDVQRRIGELRSLGYRVAIDDIGAGYSGLTSFVLLEPDLVKIDMSLVRGIDQAPLKQRVVQNLGSLCRDVGLDVIVEGVETPAECRKLLELGFDLFQGYLFAKPAKPFPVVVWP